MPRRAEQDTQQKRGYWCHGHERGWADQEGRHELPWASHWWEDAWKTVVDRWALNVGSLFPDAIRLIGQQLKSQRDLKASHAQCVLAVLLWKPAVPELGDPCAEVGRSRPEIEGIKSVLGTCPRRRRQAGCFGCAELRRWPNERLRLVRLRNDQEVHWSVLEWRAHRKEIRLTLCVEVDDCDLIPVDGELLSEERTGRLDGGVGWESGSERVALKVTELEVLHVGHLESEANFPCEGCREGRDSNISRTAQCRNSSTSLTFYERPPPGLQISFEIER